MFNIYDKDIRIINNHMINQRAKLNKAKDLENSETKLESKSGR